MPECLQYNVESLKIVLDNDYLTNALEYNRDNETKLKEARVWFSESSIVNQYVPNEKMNREAYTEAEVKKIISLVSEYGESDDKDKDIICELLEIQTGKKYIRRSIFGSCQGEYAEIIYPESEYSEEDIEYFRCAYFNEGSGWIVHNEDTIPESPYDVWGYYVWCPYSPICEADKIRAWIANGGNPEDVVLYSWKASTITTFVEI